MLERPHVAVVMALTPAFWGEDLEVVRVVHDTQDVAEGVDHRLSPEA